MWLLGAAQGSARAGSRAATRALAADAGSWCGVLPVVVVIIAAAIVAAVVIVIVIVVVRGDVQDRRGRRTGVRPDGREWSVGEGENDRDHRQPPPQSSHHRTLLICRLCSTMNAGGWTKVRPG
ncbi:hypothetical protein [Nonomuraea sp. NPDC049504]|uniref:hypothetical protein n=1 Tax=Nonomuraea sp. NPDC049504 TaxID=3154729 RepID=UPI00343A09C6